MFSSEGITLKLTDANHHEQVGQYDQYGSNKTSIIIKRISYLIKIKNFFLFCVNSGVCAFKRAFRHSR